VLTSVTVCAIDVPNPSPELRDYWRPSSPDGAAPTYSASVSEDVRERIRRYLDERLTVTHDGPIAAIRSGGGGSGRGCESGRSTTAVNPPCSRYPRCKRCARSVRPAKSLLQVTRPARSKEIAVDDVAERCDEPRHQVPDAMWKAGSPSASALEGLAVSQAVAGQPPRAEGSRGA